MSEHYNPTNIRILLTEGFGEDELRRFCYDNDDFKPLYHQLSQNNGKDCIIDRLIEYAERQLKFEDLLKWAEETNPDRYKKHQPYVDSVTARRMADSFVIKIGQPNANVPAYEAEATYADETAYNFFEWPPDWPKPVEMVQQFRAGSNMLAPQQFGQTLFQTIFTGDVEQLYHKSLSPTQTQDVKLPIRLNLQPYQLALLPWEFMFDPHKTTEIDSFLSFNEKVPLSRFICRKEQHPFNYDPANPALRLLLVSANPDPTANPQLQNELNKIQGAMARLTGNGKAHIKYLPEATIDNFATTIDDFKPHLVHFMGHGQVSRLVSTEGDDTLKLETLMIHLRHNRSLRLVVLNAGQAKDVTGPEKRARIARSLAGGGIPAIVAMQFSLDEKTALIFAQHFYETLADNRPVDEAVAWARQVMKTNLASHKVEWAAPILYLQTPDGYLFDDLLKPQEAAAAALKKAVQDFKTEATLAIPAPDKGGTGKASPFIQNSETEPLVKQVVLTKETPVIDIYYQQGEQRFDLPDWYNAIYFLQKVEEACPNYRGTTGSLLQTAREKLQEKEAQDRQKSRLTTLLKQAEQYLTTGDWREALDLLQFIKEDNATFEAERVGPMLAQASENYQEKLKEDAFKLQMAVLYERAKEEMDQSNERAKEEMDPKWERAIYILEEMERESPGYYEDVPERLRQAHLKRWLSEKYRQGLAAFGNDNWDEAAAHFYQAHVLDKTDNRVSEMLKKAQYQQDLAADYQKGLDFLKGGRWKEAVEALKSIPPADPRALDRNYAQARFIAAQDEVTAQQWDEVVKLLQPLKQAKYRDAKDKLEEAQQEKQWAASFEQGQKAIAAKHWDEAINALKAITAQKPAYKKGQAQNLQKQAETEAEFERCYTSARRQFEVERWAEAIPLLEKAHQLHPDDKSVANLLNQAGQKKKCFELNTQADTATKNKEWDQAVIILEQLVENQCDYPDVAERLETAKRQVKLIQKDKAAKQAAQAKEWKEAVRLWDEVVKEAADFPNVVDNLNSARHQARLQQLYQEYQQAGDDWGKAVKALQELTSKLTPDELKDKEYADVPALLALARQEKERVDTIQEANKRLRAEDWSGAIRVIKQHLPQDEAARKLLDIAERGQKLKQLRYNAQQQKELKQWAEAISILEEILELRQDDEEAVSSLAQARLEQDRFKLYHEAIRYADDGHLDQAISKFKELPAEYEDVAKRLKEVDRRFSLQTDFQEAKSAEKNKDWEHAVVHLENVVRVIEEQPDLKEEVESRLNRASRQSKLKQLYEEAKECFKVTAPDWPKAIMILEDLISKLQPNEPLDRDYASARELLGQARRNQELADTYKGAQEAMSAEQWEEAIEALKKLSNQPDYPQVPELLKTARTEYNFSQAYQVACKAYEAKDWKTAIEYFNESLRYKPEHAEAASLLKEANRHQKIKQLLQTGQAHETEKNWGEAIKVYNEVIVLAPAHAEARDKLSQAKVRQSLTELMAKADQALEKSQWQEAINSLTEALQIGSGGDEIKPKLQYAQQQLRLTELYQQAQADLAVGIKKPDREKLQSAIELFNQIDPEYKQTRQKLQEARRELALLDNYTLAKRLFEAKDWPRALEKFQEVGPDYRDTQDFLKSIRVNQEGQKLLLEAEKLLQRVEPSERDLFLAQTILKQIDQASSYEDEAKTKIEGIQSQLASRLNNYYDKMLDLAKTEQWQEAMGQLGKICQINPEFRDAVGMLKQIMQKASADYEEREEFEKAISIYDLSQRIDDL